MRSPGAADPSDPRFAYTRLLAEQAIQFLSTDHIRKLIRSASISMIEIQNIGYLRVVLHSARIPALVLFWTFARWDDGLMLLEENPVFCVTLGDQTFLTKSEKEASSLFVALGG